MATYFLSDGGVYDVVPGIVSPTEYRRRLSRATAHHKKLASTVPADRAQVVAHYHREMGALLAGGDAAVLAQGRKYGPGPDMRKFIVEGPIKKAFGTRPIERQVGYMLIDRAAPGAKEAPHELDAETAYNAKHRTPKVHALLAAEPLAPPQALTKVVYKTILDVDLDDPYLGLAPYVVGGEPGRN